MGKKKGLSKVFYCVLSAIMLACVFLTACSSTEKPPEKPTEEVTVTVNSVSLALSAATAKAGDKVIATATVKVATDAEGDYAVPSEWYGVEFTVDSSLFDMGTPVADGDKTTVELTCKELAWDSKAVGTVSVKSKKAASKRSSRDIRIMRRHENKDENLFEAETSSLIRTAENAQKFEESKKGSKIESDLEACSGSSAVQFEMYYNNADKLYYDHSKGDRLIWSFDTANAEENVPLIISMVGPAGWFGMWDTAECSFADMYTVKVNGKVLSTEEKTVPGTDVNGEIADYWGTAGALNDIYLGDIDLLAGKNTITFALSNRFDTYSAAEGKYIYLGGVDAIALYSTQSLTANADNGQLSAEPAGADSDYKGESKFTLNVGDAAVASYVKSTAAVAPNAELNGDDRTQFGFAVAENKIKQNKARVSITIKAPLKEENGEETLQASDVFTAIINNTDTLTFSSGIKTDGTEQTFVSKVFVLTNGDNGVVVMGKALSDYGAGSVKSIGVQYFGEDAISAKAMPAPTAVIQYKFEAEDARLVGYESQDIATASDGAKYVKVKDVELVDTNTYNNKLEARQIIFGVNAEKAVSVTFKIRYAAPFVDAQTQPEASSIGSLGDLSLNGRDKSTSCILSDSRRNDYENFMICQFETTLELRSGANRIVWSPRNWTDNEYAYLGGLDYLEISSEVVLTPYKAAFWTDRANYYDGFKSEPIKVYVAEDAKPEGSTAKDWIAIYDLEDFNGAYDNGVLTGGAGGAINYFYPASDEKTGAANGYDYWDLLKFNKHSAKPDVGFGPSGEWGYRTNKFIIAYLTNDSYNVNDYLEIGYWQDEDLYGGYVGA